MFQFTIQAAKHNNFDAVCKIARNVLNSGLSADSFKKQYLKIIEDVDQIIMIAINSGHTIGFIHARRMSDMINGSYTEIVGIALLPYYQRRGGGTLLLLGVEQWSRQMLTPDIKCILNHENKAVQKLLTSCGYDENDSGVYEKTIV